MAIFSEDIEDAENFFTKRKGSFHNLPEMGVVKAFTRLTKSFRMPCKRMNTLPLISTSFVLACFVCYVIYICPRHIELNSGKTVKQHSSRMFEIMPDYKVTTTSVAPTQAETTGRSVVANNTSHVKTVYNTHELNANHKADNVFKHTSVSASILNDVRRQGRRIQVHHNLSQLHKYSKKTASLKIMTDPEANRTGPLYNFYPGGFVDPGELVVRNCKELKPLLHIMVFSAPKHKLERRAIRQSWANQSLGFGEVTVGFLVGRTLRPVVEESLVKEQETFGDLVRPDFIEDYRNLTLKTISMLQWFSEHCNAHYLLKIDDDVALSFVGLKAILKKYGNAARGIIGHVASQNKPIRNAKNKYYTSSLQWSENKRFPPFTLGPSYLITGDAVMLLYERSLQRERPIGFLPLEDVLLAGVIAPAAKVSLWNEPFWLSEEPDTKKLLKKLFGSYEMIKRQRCIPMTSVVYHPVSEKYMVRMSEVLTQNCTKSIHSWRGQN